MNKLKFLYLFLLIIFCSEVAISQTPTNGVQACVINKDISDERRYIKDGSGNFSIFVDRNSPGQCPYSNNGLNGTNFGPCTVGAENGSIYTLTVYLCVPLDDYMPMLTILAGGLGFLYIRNKNKFLAF